MASVAIPDDQIARALVISAHPDDVDFAVAATVAGWTSAGIEVTYCVITDGQSGGFDPALDREQMPRIRRNEQQAAAALVGVSDVRFLGYVDGELEVTRALIKDLVREIRRARPDRVVIQSPERDWTRLAPSHPDHLSGGEAATQALYPAAGNPFAFRELLDTESLAPHSPSEVWLMEHLQGNHAVDVTDTFEVKLAALRCHESQHRDPDGIARLLRAKAAGVASEFGRPDGRLGEKFAVYPLP